MTDGKSVKLSNTLKLKPNSFTHLRLYVLECCKMLLFFNLSASHHHDIMCTLLQHCYIMYDKCTFLFFPLLNTIAYCELLQINTKNRLLLHLSGRWLIVNARWRVKYLSIFSACIRIYIWCFQTIENGTWMEMLMIFVLGWYVWV